MLHKMLCSVTATGKTCWKYSDNTVPCTRQNAEQKSWQLRPRPWGCARWKADRWPDCGQPVRRISRPGERHRPQPKTSRPPVTMIVVPTPPTQLYHLNVTGWTVISGSGSCYVFANSNVKNEVWNFLHCCPSVLRHCWLGGCVAV